MNNHDLEDPHPTYNCVYRAKVVDNQDPDNLGRVRFNIEGFHERSAWAYPMAVGGGNGVGTWNVPSVGEDIMVWYLLGDIDAPYFLTAPWIIGQTPESIRGVLPQDVDKVNVICTNGYEIFIDDRPTSRGFTIRDKQSGDKIEFDGLTRSMTIKATTNIKMEAIGQIDIKAAVVQINGVPAGSGFL